MKEKIFKWIGLVVVILLLGLGIVAMLRVYILMQSAPPLTISITELADHDMMKGDASQDLWYAVGRFKWTSWHAYEFRGNSTEGRAVGGVSVPVLEKPVFLSFPDGIVLIGSRNVTVFVGTYNAGLQTGFPGKATITICTNEGGCASKTEVSQRRLYNVTENMVIRQGDRVVASGKTAQDYYEQIGHTTLP